jgi:hypothetical protein
MFAAAAMLTFSAGSARAQFFVPSRTVVPYRAPAYGPYYGAGMSYIQPGSLSYYSVPNFNYYYPNYNYYNVPNYPTFYGYGYGTSIAYSSPRFGVAYSN